MATQLTDAQLAYIAARIEERWQMASTRVMEFEGESAPSLGNSEAMESLMDGIREIAYRMAGDHNSSEEAEIDRVIEQLIGTVQDEVRTMAHKLELARAEARQRSAA